MKAARLKAYKEILLVIIIWAFATIVIKFTLSGISPLPFLTYRFIISGILAVFSVKGILKLFNHKALIPYIVAYSFLSTTFALGILFFGLDKTSVVNLSLIQATEPLLLAYLGHKIFHDHLSKRAKVGVFLALIGVSLTLIDPLLGANAMGTAEGNILLMFYILSDIGSILILKRLLRKNISPLHLTNFSFLLAGASFIFISIVTGSLSYLPLIISALPLKYHIGVWYMALISGTVAYTLRSRAQKTLTISETSLFGYLVPVISTVLAVFFLSERLTVSFGIGAIFIAIGVILVEYRRKT